ncbi:MAG TPA: phosphotransferase, partial [Symbiobacteriaceae bacterium]|nr:phosphotransferase [Symbiobacteriaceae bacterium]
YDAMTWQVIHGDYYPGNLLVGPDARISAILDWDFAGPHWRELEVARGAVECALTSVGGIARGRLAAFVEAYSELSPLTAPQRRRMFRLWFNYMLWSLYPVTLRYKPGADLPREFERLARRRHAMLTLVGSHLEALEGGTV